jgi:hypothetical protein
MGTNTAERDALIRVFETYVRFGDATGEKNHGMTSRNFAKLAKDCGFLDKKLTLTHLDLAFTKASRTATGGTTALLDPTRAGKRISYAQFMLALQLCADVKGGTASQLEKLVVAQDAQGPRHNGTVAEPQRFHDDKSTFTVLQRGDSNSKLIQRHMSPHEQPPARLPAENGPVFSVFEKYALFGETVGTQALGITSRNFVKLFKDAGLLDKNVTLTTLDLTFTKAARASSSSSADAGGKRLSYSHFLKACEMVADMRGSSLQALYRTIGETQDAAPTLQGTVPKANRFHDDRSTWTASARNEALERSNSNGYIHFNTANPVRTTVTAVQAVRKLSLGRDPAAVQSVTTAAAAYALEHAEATLPEPPRGTGLPVPKPLANPPAMLGLFEQYARFGETLMTGSPGMSSRSFQKMMKDCGLLADKRLSVAFLDLAFTRATRAPVNATGSDPVDAAWGSKRISFNQFLVACELVAEARAQLGGELHSLLLLRCAAGPSVKSTVPSQSRFFDDQSTWTASARMM